MKIQIIPTLLALCITLIIPQTTFAQESLTAEDIQLKKDKLKYKSYIPAKYELFDAIQGDLNEDGTQDLILMVKSTDPNQWVVNRFDEKVDRNRRGMIVLLNEKGKYKRMIQNLDCFSSENEDGGVYYAPELSLAIEKGLVFVHYAHGRYGYWSYSFRLQGNDLRLIGYENSSNHGPYVENQTSINLLTGKKLHRDNLNQDVEADPKFKETWTKIKVAAIFLSKIKDFDELQIQ